MKLVTSIKSLLSTTPVDISTAFVRVYEPTTHTGLDDLAVHSFTVTDIVTHQTSPLWLKAVWLVEPTADMNFGSVLQEVVEKLSSKLRNIGYEPTSMEFGMGYGYGGGFIQPQQHQSLLHRFNEIFGNLIPERQGSGIDLCSRRYAGTQTQTLNYENPTLGLTLRSENSAMANNPYNLDLSVQIAIGNTPFNCYGTLRSFDYIEALIADKRVERGVMQEWLTEELRAALTESFPFILNGDTDVAVTVNFLEGERSTVRSINAFQQPHFQMDPRRRF